MLDLVWTLSNFRFRPWAQFNDLPLTTSILHWRFKASTSGDASAGSASWCMMVILCVTLGNVWPVAYWFPFLVFVVLHKNLDYYEIWNTIHILCVKYHIILCARFLFLVQKKCSTDKHTFLLTYSDLFNEWLSESKIAISTLSKCSW